VYEKRLGAVPATYVVADVCRPELLVEVEGIAFARAASAGPRRRCAGGLRSCPGVEQMARRAPYCPQGCPELSVCPHAVLPGPVS
jgi:hypothetical protein